LRLRKLIVFGAATVLLLAAVLLSPLPEIGWRKPLRGGVRASRILVVKSTRRLYLMAGSRVRSYPVALGRERGQKQRRGDRRTPEGIYENCPL
jgi:hypothetical protein